MPGDAPLLRRYVRESSQEAFAELVHRHIDFVYATALRQAGSPARAEDVTQAVFTDLARKARRLLDRDELAGWLHTSARYAAASLRRQESRRQAREEQAHVIQQLGPDASAALDWPRLQPILDEALGELGDRERDAVLLRFFKQRSFAEVGTALGLKEDAARKRVERGVEKLREILARRGITSTAVALEVAMAGQAAVAAPVGLAPAVLAGVAASGATASALTFLAGAKTTLAISAAALVAVAAYFSVQENVRLAAAQTARGAAQTKHAALTARRDRLRATLAAAQRTRATQEEAVAAGQARLRAGLTGSMSGKVSSEQLLAACTRMLEDPEWLAFGDDLLGNVWDERYDAFFRAEKVSPAVVARLRDKPRTKPPFVPKLEIVDLGDGHGSINFSAEVSETTTTVAGEEPERRILGDELFRRYQEFGETLFLRMAVVDKLASNLVYSDHPLTGAQGTQLVQLLNEHHRVEEGRDGTLNFDWEKILPAARQVLAPEQVAALARLSGLLSTHWNVDLP